MRINKYIAGAGIASRRKADELIKNGKVKINGAVLREPGYDVKKGDRIEVSGHLVCASQKYVYYALNKPVGYITSLHDEFGRPVVSDLMTDVEERVFPVGRLDADTSGLLIMTNDGDFAYHLSHPSGQVYKTYMATVDGCVSTEKVFMLRKGVDIGGYVTRPALVELRRQNKSMSVLQISISEGKNRQIRKMINAIGFNVIALERISVGNVQLGHLRPGSYRRLTNQEIDHLKKA